MKISAFVLTTNSIKNQFPFIESIKSFLPIVDELVVVDGGSTDGTVEAIQLIGDPKIRIIQDEDTKWEDSWLYSRMGHNFNRGLQECTGDWVIKFDADYVLNEKGITRFRTDCETGTKKQKLTIAFTRLNYILANRYYIKSKKTLAVNKTLCKELGIDLRYGLDLKNWGWGYDFINFEKYEHNTNLGEMIRKGDNSFVSSLTIHNYDHIFTDKETVKESRRRHWFAEMKQKELIEDVFKFSGIDGSWEHYVDLCEKNLNRTQYKIPLDHHPKIIQDRIKNITESQQGYNFWGLIEIEETNINTPEYWNEFFKQERFKKRHCWRIKPYKSLAKYFDFTKINNKTVLDIGCAFGDGLRYLQGINSTNKYHGIDYASECIKQANLKYKDISFETRDIKDLHGKYDIIIIAETLEHLDNDKEVLKKLRKLSDVLIITVPNDELGSRGEMHDVHVNNYTKDSFEGAKVYTDDNYLVAIYE